MNDTSRRPRYKKPRYENAGAFGIAQSGWVGTLTALNPRRDRQGRNLHKHQTKKNRPPRAGFFIPRQHTARDQNSIGAGEGNRTLVISLGSWSNAIIRHPLRAADFVPDVGTDLKFFFTWRAVSRLCEPQTRAVVGGQAPLLKAQDGACSPGLGFRWPVHGSSAHSYSAVGFRGVPV